MRSAQAAVLTVVSVLGAATAYEILVAVGVIDMGSLPGEGPPGGEIVGTAAGLGFVAAVIVAGALARSGDAATPLSALLAPAAAAFLVAHFFTFDSYYLPTLLRHSERDFMPPVAVFALAGLSVGAAVLTWALRSVGLALTAPLILICGLAAWFTGTGH